MPDWLFGLLAVSGIALALFAAHQVLLWMERRGWIYYLRHEQPSGSVFDAFLELQRHLEPQSRHVIERKHEIVQEEEDSGAPPDRELNPPR